MKRLPCLRFGPLEVGRGKLFPLVSRNVCRPSAGCCELLGDDLTRLQAADHAADLLHALALLRDEEQSAI